MISIIGLTFAFLLLATIMGYLVISTKMNPILKVIIIIITAWYSVALYAVPGQIAGHPKMVAELPDEAWILSAKIVEPTINDQGGMYFWLYEKRIIKEKLNNANPFMAFAELHRVAPRSYGVPYNKELHKQYEKAKKNKTGKGSMGIMLYKRGERKQGQQQQQNKKTKMKSKFQIINPIDLLPKKNQ
jgi:hypothetical protein